MLIIAWIKFKRCFAGGPHARYKHAFSLSSLGSTPNMQNATLHLFTHARTVYLGMYTVDVTSTLIARARARSHAQLCTPEGWRKKETFGNALAWRPHRVMFWNQTNICGDSRARKCFPNVGLLRTPINSIECFISFCLRFEITTRLFL